MNTVQWKMESSIGPLYLVASENGLQGVYWKSRPTAMLESLEAATASARVLAMAVAQIEEYLAGKRQTFELKFDVQGTEFQKKVWGELSKIPYGKTVSYSDIAARIKNAKAVRAVGTANGRNPLSLIVPCHRVIAADGTLGGYAGGLKIKERLLRLENSLP